MAKKDNDKLTLKDVFTVLMNEINIEANASTKKREAAVEKAKREDRIAEIQRKLGMADSSFEKRQAERRRKDNAFAKDSRKKNAKANSRERTIQEYYERRKQEDEKRKKQQREQYQAKKPEAQKTRSLSFSEQRRLEEAEEKARARNQGASSRNQDPRFQRTYNTTGANSGRTGAAQRSRDAEAEEKRRQREMVDNENAPFEVFTDFGVSLDGTPMEHIVDISPAMTVTTPLHPAGQITKEIQTDFHGTERKNALRKAIVYAEIIGPPKSKRRG